MFNVFGIRTYFKCKTLAQEVYGRLVGWLSCAFDGTHHNAGARVVKRGMGNIFYVPTACFWHKSANAQPTSKDLHQRPN